MELGREARRVGDIEAIVTIGTSFVLISLFVMCRHITKRSIDCHFARRCAATAKYGCALTHIERRYRAAWGGAEKAGGKRLAKSGGKRNLFTVYRLGKIRKYGRFLI